MQKAHLEKLRCNVTVLHKGVALATSLGSIIVISV